MQGGAQLASVQAARRSPAIVLPATCYRRRLVCASAPRYAEQLTAAAERLSTVRSRELLAACTLELLKASLVGSAADSVAAADGVDAGNEPPTPEALLDKLHESLSAQLQDAAHQIAPQHQEAWAEGQWEVFQAAQAAVHSLLMELHAQAAAAGSAAGSLQAARCLEYGLLVPQDHAAAFRRYSEAAKAGSAEGALRCGIHFFEGTAPGGRNGPRAFDYLSAALERAEASLAGSGDGEAALPPLAPPSAETAVEGDVPAVLTAEEVRFSALTWLGRCYMEGAGVQRSIAEAAACFSRAGNQAELAELASLQRLYADLQLPDGA